MSRLHPSGYPSGLPFVESNSDDKAMAKVNISSVPVVSGSVVTVSVVTSTVTSDLISAD